MKYIIAMVFIYALFNIPAFAIAMSFVAWAFILLAAISVRFIK